MTKAYCNAFSGIPIVYNAKHPPLTAGMRSLIAGKAPEEKKAVSVYPKPQATNESLIAPAGLIYSGRPCRMGSSLSGRKIIRGY